MKEKRKFLRLLTIFTCMILFIMTATCTSANTTYKNQYVKKNGQLFFYNKNGTLVKGFFKTSSGKLYYFDASTGAVKAGLQTINGKKYIINSKGAVQNGFVTYRGNRYFCSEYGIVQTGWHTIQGKRYFFDKNGIMQHGWVTSENYTFYLDETTGAKQIGWLRLDGKLYCLSSKTGALRKNTFINGKYIGPDGYWIAHPEKVFYSIMGNSSVSVSQMVELYKKRGAKYPAKDLKKGGAGNIETFCSMIVSEAKLEGVKPEVLYAQIMLETGWLQFGGDVLISQFNFGGIGATGGGVRGNSFKTVRQGIRAQVQHLKAYASTDSLKKPCIDPRFTYVSRGKTPYVEWLGIPENPYGYGWAAGKNYGFELMKVIDELKLYS